jgi:hypothetical protein
VSPQRVFQCAEKQESAVYGRPRWILLAVGVLKVLCAPALIAGIWMPPSVARAATLLLVLIIGAIATHLKVK